MTLSAQLTFNWVFLWSAITIQVCISLSTTVANSQHPPSAYFHDNNATRNLGMADMDSVTDHVDGVEERVGATTFLSLESDNIQMVSPSQPYVNNLYDSIMGQKAIKMKFFASHEYADWEKKVMEHFKDNREMAAAAIVKTLVSRNKSILVRKMLAATKKKSLLMKTITSTFELEQLRFWERKRISPNQIFSWLNLRDKEGDILEDPALPLWMKYVSNGREPKEATLKLVEEVQYTCSVKKFADFLVNAHVHPSTLLEEPIAARDAIDKEITVWLNDDKSSDEVYKLLELDKDPTPLTSPAINVWLLFAREKERSPSSVLFPKLQEKYTEEADLADAITTFKPVFDEGIHSTLMERLFDHWLMDKKSEKDVFEILRLSQPDRGAAWETYFSWLGYSAYKRIAEKSA